MVERCVHMGVGARGQLQVLFFLRCHQFCLVRQGVSLAWSSPSMSECLQGSLVDLPASTSSTTTRNFCMCGLGLDSGAPGFLVSTLSRGLSLQPQSASLLVIGWQLSRDNLFNSL